MNVGELINQLSAYPRDALVVSNDTTDGYNDVSVVYPLQIAVSVGYWGEHTDHDQIDPRRWHPPMLAPEITTAILIQ